MSAHVFMNLLNESRKRDKMRVLLSILSFFRNEFNKFNNTGARIIDYIYHMTLTLLKSRENVKNFPYFTQRYNGRDYVTSLNL